MTFFNEENIVEQMVLDTLRDGVTSNMVAEEQEIYPRITQMNADENPKKSAPICVIHGRMIGGV